MISSYCFNARRRPAAWVSASLAVIGIAVGVLAYSDGNVDSTPNQVLELATVVTGPSGSNNLGSNVNLAANDEVLWVIYHGGIQPIDTASVPSTPEIVQGQVAVPDGFTWVRPSPASVLSAPPKTILTDATFTGIAEPNNATIVAGSSVYWKQSPYSVTVNTAANTINNLPSQSIDIDDYFKCDPVRARMLSWDKVRLYIPGALTGLTNVTLRVKDNGGTNIISPLSRTSGFANALLFDISGVTARVINLEISLQWGPTATTTNNRQIQFDVLWKGDPAQTCFTAKAPTSLVDEVTTQVTVKRYLVSNASTSTTTLDAGQRFDPLGSYTGNGSVVITGALPAAAASGASEQLVVLMPRYNLKDQTGDLLAFTTTPTQVTSASYASASAAVNNTASLSVDVAKNRSDRTIKFTDFVFSGTAGFADIDLFWNADPTKAPIVQDRWNVLARGQTDIFGDERLRYVRGARDNEAPSGQDYRKRKSVLGPVAHSSPSLLPQTPPGGYPASLFPKHPEYRALSQRIRPAPYVFFGAHDGMLHAFKVTTDNGTGLTEAFSYAPPSLFEYAHSFTDVTPAMLGLNPFAVDGTPMIRDIRTSNWHTVVVSAFGRGRRGLFALKMRNSINTTDPQGFPADTIFWEYTNAYKPTASQVAAAGTVAGVPVVKQDDLRDLGQMVYTPPVSDLVGAEQIVRMSNGRWAAVVGNGIKSQIGPDSTSNGPGRAVLYLFYFSDRENEQPWQRIAVAETGTDAVNNGLMSPRPVDVDEDGNIDYVYAGDIKGNLWRFDVRNLPTVTVTKLFAAGADKPITAAPVVRRHVGSQPTCGTAAGCWMVVFGTGYPAGPLTPGPYTLGTQSVYGILDDLSGTTVTNSQLVVPTLSATTASSTTRTVTPDTTPWTGKKGWKIDLEQGEQMFANAVTYSDNSVMLTTARYFKSSSSTPKRSWLTQLNIFTGAGVAVFGTSASRAPSLVVAGSLYETPPVLPSTDPRSDTETLVLPVPNTTPGANPNLTLVTKLKPPKLLGRLSWREIYEDK